MKIEELAKPESRITEVVPWGLLPCFCCNAIPEMRKTTVKCRTYGYEEYTVICECGMRTYTCGEADAVAKCWNTRKGGRQRE